jgi:hypothetical protein
MSIFMPAWKVVPAILAIVTLAGWGCDRDSEKSHTGHSEAVKTRRPNPGEGRSAPDAGAFVVIANRTIWLTEVPPENMARIQQLAQAIKQANEQVARSQADLQTISRERDELEAPLREAKVALDHARSRRTRAIARYQKAKAMLDEDLKKDDPSSTWPFESSPLRVTGNEVRQLAMQIDEEEQLCRLAQKELAGVRPCDAAAAANLAGEIARLEQDIREARHLVGRLELEALNLADRPAN